MVGRAIGRLMAPIARRVRLLARRAVVALINDAPKMQELQIAIYNDEVRDRVERWQDYGFTSHPHPGAEAIVLALGGNTDHGAVIKVDDRRYRKTDLTQGEVAIYDDQGQVITLKRGNLVEIETAGTVVVKAGTKMRVETPVFEVTGTIKDKCDTTGRAMDSMRQIYNMHDHDENDYGGPTDQPNQSM